LGKDIQNQPAKDQSDVNFPATGEPDVRRCLDFHGAMPFEHVKCSAVLEIGKYGGHGSVLNAFRGDGLEDIVPKPIEAQDLVVILTKEKALHIQVNLSSPLAGR
jgi:hypothetical protein